MWWMEYFVTKHLLSLIISGKWQMIVIIGAKFGICTGVRSPWYHRIWHQNLIESENNIDYNIPRVVFALILILQVVHNFLTTHNFFQTYGSWSQQMKLESWTFENTQLLKSIYANCSSINQNTINLSTLSLLVTREWIFWPELIFNASTKKWN